MLTIVGICGTFVVSNSEIFIINPLTYLLLLSMLTRTCVETQIGARLLYTPVSPLTVTPSQFWNCSPDISSHGPSEWCAQPSTVTKQLLICQERQLEDLQCRTTSCCPELRPGHRGGAYRPRPRPPRWWGTPQFRFSK